MTGNRDVGPRGTRDASSASRVHGLPVQKLCHRLHNTATTAGRRPIRIKAQEMDNVSWAVSKFDFFFLHFILLTILLYFHSGLIITFRHSLSLTNMMWGFFFVRFLFSFCYGMLTKDHTNMGLACGLVYSHG